MYNIAFSTTSYSSREGANAPQLVIETSTGATNTPTATNTPGPTSTPTRTPTSVGTNTPTVPPTVTPTTQPVFQNASFIYDGDAKRVKSIINNAIITYFVGAHYEVSGSTIIKYYYAGAQRIAMRSNGTLNYLLGDHLGSTSLTTDAAGNKISEVRYKAWGEVRYAWGNVPTKYQYTGQFSYEAEFGLYFYNARWYDSALGRFAQADNIIPEQTQGVQAWDRFAYVNNNPLLSTDPSGHNKCDDISANGECVEYSLDYTGYSAWERKILEKLYNEGGPDAQHGVEYILSNEIHIELAEELNFGRPAWFDSDTVFVVPDSGKNTVFDSPWALSNIIHEALHIEQGFALSHSIEGERLAWQAGLRVYRNLVPSAFGPGSAYANVLTATDPMSFLNVMYDQDSDYKVQMLTFYPEYPGGVCHGGLLWCLYLKINSR